MSALNNNISEEEQLRRQAEDEKNRFTIELEFIQCLANPHYLHFLAQRGYFNDDSMVNYLKYLNYWRRPEYARHLRYPQCLYMLELLQNASFREAISNQQCAKFIEDQILLHWQYYNRKRGKIERSEHEKSENEKASQQQQNNFKTNENSQSSKVNSFANNTTTINTYSSSSKLSMSSSGTVPLKKEQQHNIASSGAAIHNNAQ